MVHVLANALSELFPKATSTKSIPMNASSVVLALPLARLVLSLLMSSLPESKKKRGIHRMPRFFLWSVISVVLFRQGTVQVVFVINEHLFVGTSGGGLAAIVNHIDDVFDADFAIYLYHFENHRFHNQLSAFSG